ncbi:MAG: Xaa-Pro peptidase family protein [Firmicutes bacterium]|nr:Xaa-Pro peptidase family protein [Bacillota bacterium]
MAYFTTVEYRERIQRLQSLLLEKEIDLAVLNLNSDLYYYTGSVLPLYLLVPAAGAPLSLARKGVEQARNQAAHLQVEAFNNTRDLTRIIDQYGLKGRRIGFTLDTSAYATVQRWLQLFEAPAPVDLSSEVRYLRMVKSETEIAIQRRAGRVMAGVPQLVKSGFRPGMTELELSALVENYFRLHGHAALVRCRREGSEMNFGVCAAGLNSLAGTKFDGICAGVGLSLAAPYGANDTPIPQGVPVILDYAFNLDGYHLDQTRMFCWGTPQDAALEAYEAMIKIENEIIASLRPGGEWSEIYDKSAALAAKMGYGAEFMGLGPEKVKFVGHGVGLELDEPPFLAPKMEQRLAAGMVVAVEPKVALPGIGVIGIEDTLAIRETGPEMLTDCPREFIIADK